MEDEKKNIDSIEYIIKKELLEKWLVSLMIDSSSKKTKKT